MRSPNLILPAVPAQLDDVIPTMSLDHPELRGGHTRYTSRLQELTECQFWYVQGRFRR